MADEEDRGRYDRAIHGDGEIKEDSGTIELLIEVFIGIGCATVICGILYYICGLIKRKWAERKDRAKKAGDKIGPLSELSSIKEMNENDGDRDDINPDKPRRSKSKKKKKKSGSGSSDSGM